MRSTVKQAVKRFIPRIVWDIVQDYQAKLKILRCDTESWMSSNIDSMTFDSVDDQLMARIEEIAMKTERASSFMEGLCGCQELSARCGIRCGTFFTRGPHTSPYWSILYIADYETQSSDCCRIWHCVWYVGNVLAGRFGEKRAGTLVYLRAK
jgi:hypothetical protein